MKTANNRTFNKWEIFISEHYILYIKDIIVIWIVNLPIRKHKVETRNNNEIYCVKMWSLVYFSFPGKTLQENSARQYYIII